MNLILHCTGSADSNYWGNNFHHSTTREEEEEEETVRNQKEPPSSLINSKQWKELQETNGLIISQIIRCIPRETNNLVVGRATDHSNSSSSETESSHPENGNGLFLGLCCWPWLAGDQKVEWMMKFCAFQNNNNNFRNRGEDKSTTSSRRERETNNTRELILNI